MRVAECTRRETTTPRGRRGHHHSEDRTVTLAVPRGCAGGLLGRMAVTVVVPAGRLFVREPRGSVNEQRETSRRKRNGRRWDALDGRRMRKLRRPLGLDAIALFQGMKLVTVSAAPKGIIDHGSVAMIQEGTGTVNHIGLETAPRYVDIMIIGPMTPERTVDPLKGIVVDTATPRGRVEGMTEL